MAAVFAVGLNFVLLATFVWPEMVPAPIRVSAWVGLIAFWGTAMGLAMRQAATIKLGRAEANQEGLFVRAQAEYLRGHWLEAESLLRRILQIDDRDGDARLMLVSLLRRSERPIEAMAELEALELSEAGRKWGLETARERQLLDGLREQRTEERDD